MPTRGQPINTMTIPPKKAIEAFILCFWKKKRNVLSKPITQAKPAMNRICVRNIINILKQKTFLLHLRSPGQANFYRTVVAYLGTGRTFQSLLGPHQSLQKENLKEITLNSLQMKLTLRITYFKHRCFLIWLPI